ncbi:MAG: TIGR00296 family protein [Candidatus Diapherotrites archaeon]|nr:TIGR00296 family protein [Candidatus Diapherotrites archaeon]
MAEKLTLEEGEKLVKLARKSISYALASGSLLQDKAPDKKFLEKRGVFVTLNSQPGGELRGCIGLPYPVKPLWTAVGEAAISAALRDPRFPQVKSKELEKITIEISVLTPPEKIDKESLPDSVKIGEHGLIIEKGPNSGLLLPQVATEYGWDAETFLEQVCLKAGLYAKAWKVPDATIKTFSAQIFSEEAPEGKIVEKKE